MLAHDPPPGATGNLPAGPALLCVGHPGHELRVYGWLTLARPRVFVLTDGSGRSGRPRLAVTRRTLAETGASPGEVFGAMSDAEAYALIVARDARPFAAAIDRLAAAILAARAGWVAGDAAEGYNPTHDLTRVLINAAVEIAAARGHRAANYDFPLVAAPDACPARLRPRAVEIVLDAGGLARKLAAARRSPDLAIDVEAALASAGEAAFGRELLRPVDDAGPTDGLPDEVPFYERHGEARVASGKYAAVLRRREHVLPLAEAIWRHVEAASR